MSQLNMFSLLVDPPVPYVAGSDTSKQAADAARSRVTNDRDRVLAYLRYIGSHGATDEELQDALEMNPSTERPRRIELVEQHAAMDSGMTRKTKSGRAAVVWIARK